MKTLLTITRKISLGFLLTLIATFALCPVQAQTGKVGSNEVAQNERIIKGLISDDSGPLENVNILLKNTKIGTSTDSKGEFTFPISLKTGDVLLISYLGYETQEVTIRDDNNFLRMALTEDLIEFSGALNSNKPYKSKRYN